MHKVATFIFAIVALVGVAVLGVQLNSQSGVHYWVFLGGMIANAVVFVVCVFQLLGDRKDAP